MQFDTDAYEHQLSEKQAHISALFADMSLPTMTIARSPKSHYRMRAEFRVWHDGDDLYHIMFDQNTKQKIRVDQFLPACTTINKAMEIVVDKLKACPVMRKKLFQIDYLSALSGELVVSLLYHRPLDDEWQSKVEALQSELSSQFTISFIGRARKQKRIVGNDYVIEKLPINDTTFTFKHIENSFTQPNATVNCAMIEWAIAACDGLSGDLVEFYCGAGNFSLPLAASFDHVVGTEIAKPSVEAAQFNIQANALDNVKIVRLAAEEFTQAMRGERTFNRLEGLDLSAYNFTTALVDPPRAGLDSDTLKLIQDYDNIIYISCNPETLKQNLVELTKTHIVTDFALFDQFPYTHHIECGVKLTKRSAS